MTAPGVHRPRKRFGQHFLYDPGVIARIIAAIAPAADDAIIEIGPGDGALTRPLLERVQRVEAIEIDRDLAARLRATWPPERLVVHCADVLGFDFAELGSRLRIVGNLPYNVSTPLLFHLVRYAERLRDLHFMLQAEVVARMSAMPGSSEYGRLSVMLQTRFRVEPLFRVAAGSFHPPPKVESAVVRLVPIAQADRPQVDEKTFAEVVTLAFSARRKMLRNALPLNAEDFTVLGIDPKLRPENLSPLDYVRIARRLSADVR